MNIVIVSVGHSFQPVEAGTDSAQLSAQKSALRELLLAHIAEHKIAVIFEEWSRPEMTIASQLAIQNDPAMPWRNIDRTDDERRAAGIFDEQSNRPEHLVWDDGPMPNFIQDRVPSDADREDFFVNRILEASDCDGEVLVLLGNMHVMQVEGRLRASGHNVSIRDELFPV